MTKQFIDKNENLVYGIEFYAVGLIESPEPFVSKVSGKDVLVIFIDPWGRLIKEWRALDSIEIKEIEEWNADLLRYAYNEWEKRHSK